VASQVLPEGPPPLPPGPFLSAPDLPGFRFKVQIVGGATPVAGTQEASCLPETVCVSGALPGRSEVFVRVVGPKPNGFLQPTLVKFSTSRIRIWIEQVAIGIVKFYELDPVGPAGPGDGALSILDGLIDQTGFLPAGAPASAAPARRVVRGSGVSTFVSRGWTVECPGRSRTSSNVSASGMDSTDR